MAARNAASFARRKAHLAPQPTVLVLCEDTKASIAYLNDAARHFRASPHIRVDHCGRTDPLGIVEEAVRQRRRYDEVYCVIDRNGHQSFDDALVLVRDRAGLAVIPSDPCFEYWLLLHFGYTRAGFTAVGAKSSCDHLIDALRQQAGMNAYDKGNVQGLFDRMLAGDLFARARLNAARALQDAINVDEPNPSTHLHHLMDRFEKLGRLQAAE